LAGEKAEISQRKLNTVHVTVGTPEGETVFEQRPGGVEIAGGPGSQGVQTDKRMVEITLVLEIAGQRSALLQQRPGLIKLAQPPTHLGGARENLREAVAIAQPPPRCQGFVGSLAGLVVIAHLAGKRSGDDERPSVGPGAGGRTSEEAVDAFFALAEVATETPKPLSSPGDASGNLEARYRVVVTLALMRLLGQCLPPLDRGPEVVVLRLETVQPESSVWPAKVRPGALGECEEVLGVSPAEPLGFATRLKPLQGELSDCLQHGEARLAIRTVDPAHEALVDQRRNAIQEVQGQSIAPVAHCLDGRERGATDEGG
jgi:hypothetical protein